MGGTTKEDRFAEMDEAIIRQKQRDRQGIWLGPNIDGNPSAMTVADLDGDGRQEIAMVMDTRLLVARIVDGEFSEVAEVVLPIRLQILTMDAVDLDGNAVPDGRTNAISRIAYIEQLDADLCAVGGQERAPPHETDLAIIRFGLEMRRYCGNFRKFNRNRF